MFGSLSCMRVYVGNPNYNGQFYTFQNVDMSSSENAGGARRTRVLAPTKTALVSRDGFVDARTCTCHSACDI